MRACVWHMQTLFFFYQWEIQVIDQIADHSKYLAPFFMKEEEVGQYNLPTRFFVK